VNLIRYDVRHLASNDPDYAALFAASAGPGDAGLPGESDRTELIREELDPTDGSAIAGTREIVAEYAVDLNFQFTAFTNNVMETHDSSEFGDFFLSGEDPLGAVQNVERIRSVRVRLSVRSREADRATDVAGGLSGLYRIGLGAGGGAPFARVRTFQADVALHNQSDLTW
jgi:hypothetical protein